MKYILMFGVVFTILQISDMVLTQYALRNTGIRELNPFYTHDYFIPFKLTVVLLIMITMYRQPVQNQVLAKKTMLWIIFMYVLINLNNLYFALL